MERNITLEEYDRLIIAEEKLRILEEALKWESKGGISSSDFVKVATCVLGDDEAGAAAKALAPDGVW